MIILDGQSLSLDDLVFIARHHEKVSIAKESIQKIKEASSLVEELIKKEKPIYGINTGFGHLADVKIANDKLDQLQINLLKSHACSMGDPLSIEVVRAMMTLRINALIKGFSGTRLETIELMVTLLNENIIPVIFEQGSLGASGDLALLAHMGLPLLGLGEVYYKNDRMAADTALLKANIKPLEKLYPKEGLSLINGTQAMTAIGALVLYDAFKLIKFINLSLSLTMEALESIIDAFDPRIQDVRKHLGQMEVADEIKRLLENSQNITNQCTKRVQDAYSIRCAPQVHGASLDVFHHVKNIIDIEMNSVTDNPILFVDEKQAISAGNFHGQPLALAFDYLGMAIAELANISERRIERLVNPKLNDGLPPFLTPHSGVNSGFMIVQYAAASIVSENKVIAHPASVDSIPSSANQEDHVSMGATSARKAKTILENTRKVIALEMFTASQALHFRGHDKLGVKTKVAFDLISKDIPSIKKDTVMYPYIHQAEKLLIDDKLYHLVFKGDETID